MTKKLSMAASGLLLSTTMAFSADSIDNAFKEGTISGSLTAYALEHDGKGSASDTDSGFATINLGYETASYMGLTAKAGFEAGHGISDGTLANDALMTNQQAAADEDEIGDFTQIGTDGAYVADIKYVGLDGVEFNPYYYSVPNIADWYGLKATYTADMFGAVAHYAASSEDVGSDGSIGHIEVNTSLSGVSAALGYIKTDKTAGVGSIAAVGDNITPFDNGGDNYAIDAKTTYGSLGYSIGAVDLGALYGETDFAANSESNELNLSAGYSFTDSLSLGLLYVDYDLEGSSLSDYKEYSATLAYSF